MKAKRFVDPDPGGEPLRHRPVIVGSGPAGLLAGYYLAKRGYRPLILERGRPVKERARAIRAFDAGGPFEPENNYLFGEGGAGAWSDGKLTCRVTGPDVDYVLDAFVACGGRSGLRHEHRPHLGSNKLPMICRNFRRATEAAGGEYRFGVTVEGLDLRDGRVAGLHTSAGHVEADRVILAIGHSARDTYESLLASGVPMGAKAFQLGVRVEHPQELVNRRKYGKPEYLELLGAADYSLVAPGARDLYTFCMCAGGWIIPSVSEPGRFCTNGMSNSRHETPWANSGLVVTLEPAAFGPSSGGKIHPLAGVEVQRKAEGAAFAAAGGDYSAPVQRATDYLRGRRSDDWRGVQLQTGVEVAGPRGAAAGPRRRRGPRRPAGAGGQVGSERGGRGRIRRRSRPRRPGDPRQQPRPHRPGPRHVLLPGDRRPDAGRRGGRLRRRDRHRRRRRPAGGEGGRGTVRPGRVT